jgi:hypothetical protein
LVHLEHADVRIEDLCIDAVQVHVLQPLDRVVVATVGVLNAAGMVRWPLVPARAASEPCGVQLLAAEHPHVFLRVGVPPHLRQLVDPLPCNPGGPQVGRLDDVRVGVDDADVVEV